MSTPVDMGTREEADARFMKACDRWIELRQPLMSNGAGHKAREVLEHEARFVLANAAIHLAWFMRQPKQMPSGLDMLLDRQADRLPDGSQEWFAVSNPKAIRNQPMALFRLKSDAQLVGGRMSLGETVITPVTIRLPDDVEQPDAPMPPITIITD